MLVKAVSSGYGNVTGTRTVLEDKTKLIVDVCTCIAQPRIFKLISIIFYVWPYCVMVLQRASFFQKFREASKKARQK